MAAREFLEAFREKLTPPGTFRLFQLTGKPSRGYRLSSTRLRDFIRFRDSSP